MILTGWKEWSIACLAALAVYTLYWFGGSWKTGLSLRTDAVSYEMQRVRNSYYGQFDLSNREIEYRVAEDKTVGHVAPAVPAVAQRNPAPTKAVVAKKEAAKKKDPIAEAKKKKAELAKKQELARKQRLAVRVVDTGVHATMTSEPVAIAKSQSGGAYFQPNTQSGANQNTNDNNTEQNQKLSPGQWFSLLQAQPTTVNAQKFKEAKSDLGEKSYYDILTKLLKDSQQDRQKVALIILNSDVSMGTFQYLTSLPADFSTDANLASGLSKIQKSYEDKSRFSILAQALNSPNNQVVLASQVAISSAANRISATNTTTSSGPRVTALTVNDFNIFKSTLAKLSQSKNPQIAQSSKDLFAKIWQTSPVNTQVAGNQ